MSDLESGDDGDGFGWAQDDPVERNYKEVVGNMDFLIRHHDFDAVRAWLETSPLDALTYPAHAFLFCFLCWPVKPGARGPRKEMLRLLLSHGAEPNSEAHYSRPLHHCKTPEEAALLLDAGALINAKLTRALPGQGDTPLAAVAKSAKCEPGIDLVRFLVSRGADVDYSDPWGETPEDLAATGLRETKAQVQHYGNLPAFGFLKEHVDFYEGILQFFADLRSAGGWKPYARAPRIELVRLRALCARGRARPPSARREPALARLFETGANPRRSRAIPNEVFWHVLSFWRTSRETFGEPW